MMSEYLLTVIDRMDLPLQIEPGGLPAVEALVLLVSGVLTAILGLFIGYQAYRGYRRNSSRPMLFLSSGLVLLTAVSFSVSVVLGSLGGQNPFVTLSVQRAIELTGLACIMYALYGGHDRTEASRDRPRETTPQQD